MLYAGRYGGADKRREQLQWDRKELCLQPISRAQRRLSTGEPTPCQDFHLRKSRVATGLRPHCGRRPVDYFVRNAAGLRLTRHFAGLQRYRASKIESAPIGLQWIRLGVSPLSVAFAKTASVTLGRMCNV